MLRKLHGAAAGRSPAGDSGRRARHLYHRPDRSADRPAGQHLRAGGGGAAHLYRGVNAAGGIDGKKINLILQDDSAEPGKATANAKKLITQDNVLLMLNASLSSTYAPVVAEAKRAGVPVLFASSVCPKDVYPPADPLLFCTTAFASNYDSRATLAFIKDNRQGAG